MLLVRRGRNLQRRFKSHRVSRLPADGPGFYDFVSSQPLPRRTTTTTEEERSLLLADTTAKLMASKQEYLGDRFGRFHNYLRISLTERCNLRCTYCMPSDGVPLSPRDDLLTTEEIERLALVFAAMGTTKVRLTGGEPTLRKDLVEVCRSISSLDGVESLGMTTNGVALLKKTGTDRTLLLDLYEAGMRSINISLDSVRSETFETLTRRPAKTALKVLEAVQVASKLPGLKVKINCVVMRGQNDTQLPEFIRYFLEHTTNVDVRFIEWMPFNANEWDQKILVSLKDIIDILQNDNLKVRALDPVDPNDTTKWFRVKESSHEEKSLRVGVISSMTDHFCGGCNRLRITSDGALKTCLFGDDALSLRDLMRQGKEDQELAFAVKKALTKKHFAHGGKGQDGAASIARASDTNRPMILIGG